MDIKNLIENKIRNYLNFENEPRLDETTRINHDRYKRSHMKNASLSTTGLWMFTNKRSGSPDWNDEDEVFEFSGKGSEAFKAAKKWGEKRGYSDVYVMESLDEGVLKPYQSPMQKPFSDTKKRSENTPGEYKLIGKGDDFEVYAQYGGSLKRQLHVVVRNDEIIGSGWTMPSALKDAKLKPKDVKHFSKFVKGSILNTMKENKKLTNEARSKEDYTISHKTFSSAVQHAIATVEKRGYEVDEDEWDRKVALGPRKPSKGKTNSYTIALLKDGKETRRNLQMQVYYDEGRYELNVYIS